MRVPISLADLRVKYGFNRIAKKLQRNWRSAFSLSLASSQEILSKGLGYQDLHDLQTSASEHGKNVAETIQDEVRDGISNAITAFCQSKKVTDMDERDVIQLVSLLPLHELTVFQMSRSQQPSAPASQSVFELITRPANDLTRAANQQQSTRPRDDLSAELRKRPADPISQEDLKRFWEVVQRKGSLHDQCLSLGLLQGIRPLELLNVKAHDVYTTDEHSLLRIKNFKSRSRSDQLFMPLAFGTLIDEYVRQAKIPPMGYLFPSQKDANVPMSLEQMHRIIGVYLRESITNPMQRRAYSILQSARDLAKNLTLEQLAEKTGHRGTSTTMKYLRIPKSSSKK
ncbi:hypothetical protein LRQ11_18095 [Pseudomonas sp. MAFF 311095]|uniref:Tyr recombinase domain-containing protein n=1 Tax=Pseudomonas petroselini TaxID=2899822 RepID=A0ABS8QNV4_9PSED|nr:hypothetical protein [Pseudomonas petroselini]MCD7037342.1 hypothetical protein [Pseudomonas petroselini]MCD7047404.1 hypothetical protein [Pseudomonas petroselini]MCD7069345.1 hypothetical protein [Pseudomonas petroselini]MCD7080632.1 hypothetical protein [Pseudomonas petroselini]